MIPARIDILTIITDLTGRGLLDYKIECICDLPNGYIGKLRTGNIKEPSYAKAARLFNFWEDEMALADARSLSNTT